MVSNRETGRPDYTFPSELELREAFDASSSREHARQREILASSVALELFRTRDEYIASLPSDFGPKRGISLDTPLAPAIIDPRIRLERLLAITGITANINVQATKDLEEDGPVISETPYIIKTIVVTGDSFGAALALRENPSFRGATAIEGAIHALYNRDLLDENPIYLPGSRTEQIWMPNVRKTREGRIEMSSDLPIDRPGQGKLSFLLVAR